MPMIDEKIVSMQFDNSEFDPEIKKSQKTLTEFEKSLDSDKFSKYADKINKTDFTPINNSLTSLGNVFKSVETIATGALLNIGMKLENFTAQQVKSLTIDQVTAGWSKYGDKVTSVQTIMAATSKQFKDTETQMRYVSNQLDTLNRFTDETSYSFVDMVSNIGKFTSKGIQLDTAVAAMEGISTWAALSGQGAESAAHAMYNLSQAIGQGYLKLIDWRSIQIANMDTVEFKETAIETAKALGTLKESADGTLKTIKGNAVTVKSFEQNLSDAWLTSDVLMKTLEKYGGFAQKLIESMDKTGLTAEQTLRAIDDYRNGVKTLDQILAETTGDADELEKVLLELGTEEYDLGRKAFRASFEAKTLGEAINYVKDAVSTGWTTSFEYLFGNYQEAKELWTWFSNVLYEVFVRTGEIRNEVLKLWHDAGGFRDILDGLKAIWDYLLSVRDIFAEVLGTFFPQLTEEGDKVRNLAGLIRNITLNFKNWAQSLELTDEKIEKIKSSARILGNALKGLLEIINLLHIFIAPTVRFTKELLKSLGGLITPLAKATDEASGFTNVIQGLRTAFLLLGVAVALPIKALSNLITWLQRVGNMTLPELKNKIVTWLNDVWNSFVAFIKLFPELGSRVIDGFKEGIKGGINGLWGFFTGIFTGIINLVKSIFGIHSPSLVFATIGGMLIAGLITGLIAGKGNLKAGIESIFGMIITALDFTSIFIDKFFDNLDHAIDRTSDSLMRMIPIVMTLADAIMVLAGSFVGLYVSKIWSDTVYGAVGAWGDSLYKYVKNKYKAEIFKQLGNTILKIAFSIIGLAAAFAVLANIPMPNMADAAKVLGGITIGLALFITTMAILIKTLQTGSASSVFSVGESGFFKKLGVNISGETKSAFGLSAELVTFSLALIAISVAVSILVNAVRTLAKDLTSGDIGLPELMISMLMFIIVTGSLAALSIILTKLDLNVGKVLGAVAQIVIFAAALIVFSNTLRKISEIEIPDLLLVLRNLLILTLGITAFAIAISLFNKGLDMVMKAFSFGPDSSKFAPLLKAIIQISIFVTVLKIFGSILNSLAKIKIPNILTVLKNFLILTSGITLLTLGINFILNTLPKVNFSNISKLAMISAQLLSFVWLMESFVGVFSKMANVLSKIYKVKEETGENVLLDILKIVGIFLTFTAAILVLFNKIKTVKSIDLGTLYGLVTILQITLLGLTGVIAILSKIKGVDEGIANLVKLESFILVSVAVMMLLSGLMSKVPNMGIGIAYLAAIFGILTGSLFTVIMSLAIFAPVVHSLMASLTSLIDYIKNFAKDSEEAFKATLTFIAFVVLLRFASTLLALVSASMFVALVPLLVIFTTFGATMLLVALSIRLTAESFVIAATSIRSAARIFVDSFDLLKDAKEKLKQLFTSDMLQTLGVMNAFAGTMFLLGIGGLVGSLGILTLSGAIAVMSTTLGAFTKVLDFFKTISWESIAGMAKLSLGLLALGLVMLIVSPGILTLALSALILAGAFGIVSATLVLLGNNTQAINAVIDVFVQRLSDLGNIVSELAKKAAEAGGGLIVFGIGLILTGVGLTLVAMATLALVVNMLLAIGVLALFNLVLNWIKDTNPDLYDSIMNLVNAVVMFFTAVATTLPKIIEIVYDIVAMAKDVWNRVTRFWDQFIQPWIDGFASIGKNVVQGFVDGINSMISTAKSTVIGWANNILGWFGGKLEIHSPSREFYDMGQATMDGYIDGVKSKQQEAYETMEETAEMLEEPFRDGLSYADWVAEQNKKKADQAKKDSYAANRAKIADRGNAKVEQLLEENTKTTKEGYDAVIAAEDTTIGGALGNIWTDVKNIFSDVKDGRKTIGQGFSALFESLKKHGGTFLGDKIDGLKNMLFGEGGPLSAFSDLLNGDMFSNLFKGLDLENLLKDNGLGDLDKISETLANMNTPDMSNIGEGTTGSMTSSQSYIFTQNNYSPKALSRLEIYRQTNRQFNDFRTKEILSR